VFSAALLRQCGTNSFGVTDYIPTFIMTETINSPTQLCKEISTLKDRLNLAEISHPYLQIVNCAIAGIDALINRDGINRRLDSAEPPLDATLTVGPRRYPVSLIKHRTSPYILLAPSWIKPGELVYLMVRSLLLDHTCRVVDCRQGRRMADDPDKYVLTISPVS
jgi:hypothetical protein